MNIRKTSFIAPTLALLLSVNVYAKDTYTIENKSLKQAIESISKKSNIPYLVNEDLLEGKDAINIKDIQGTQNALDKILRNSTLEAIITNGTIIIRKKQTSSSNNTKLNDIEIIENESDITEGKNSYTISSMSTSTKMNLSILETPQTVSVVTREKMNDFSLTTLNNVLKYTPGVTVEEIETDRTKYTSRGFEISNFQVDGISLPLDMGYGQQDTVIYDHVEVTKGASGLSSGAGDPSATVNMIRKRPTKEFKGYSSINVGSWDKKRFETDISGAISDDKSLRARLVYAHEKKGSYLDRYESEKNIFYGIVEKDISDSTKLTFGITKEKDRPNSSSWGALPRYYTDGTATNFHRNISTSSEWSYWDNTKDEIFTEVEHILDNDWMVKAVFNHKETKADSNLFYMYGTPDSSTQAGLTGYASEYKERTKEQNIDIYAKGPFTLAGNDHEAVFGLSWSKKRTKQASLYDYTNGFPAIPNLYTWNGVTAQMNYKDRPAGSDFTDRQKAIYAATNLSLNEDISLILGTRLSNWQTNGSTYSNNISTKDNSIITPYAGLIYKIKNNISTYVSYTTSFKPQGKVDKNFKAIDPTESVNLETGIKGSFFNNALNTSFSIFKITQDNATETGAKIGAIQTYTVTDGLTSKGYEMEVSGQVLEGWQVGLGYTRLNIEDEQNKAARTYIPKHAVKLSTSYKLQSIPNLKLGASVNWQDDIYKEEGKATTGANIGKTIISKQEAYALVNLMASYKFSKNLSASLNLNNITDEKYYTSLYSAQSYYGAPRSTYLTLKWDF